MAATRNTQIFEGTVLKHMIYRIEDVEQPRNVRVLFD